MSVKIIWNFLNTYNNNIQAAAYRISDNIFSTKW